MEYLTAEQAAEAARGLTFEKVWAALMESRLRMEEMRAENQKRDEEWRVENQKRDEEFQKRMEESHQAMKESQQAMKKTVDELSKNIGGVNNSLGRFTESLFSVGLDKRFNELGYEFTKQAPHVKFNDKASGKVLAEADYFLEDGQYAMAVEVKTDLRITDVDEHVVRIKAIRGYFDERSDKRLLVGVVAGGVIHGNVMQYAHEQGFYVITQAGDSAVIAEPPQGFKAREW